MKVYIVEHAIGSFAYDEQGKLIDFVLSSKDLGKVVDSLLDNEKGIPLPTTIELIQKIKPEEVVVENEAEIPNLQQLGVKASYEIHNLGSRIFRESLPKIAIETKFASSENDLYSFLYEVSFEYTRRKLRTAASKRDLLAIQAIRAIDDIDKTINLFSERLREWYSIHFPELNKLVEDHELYASIVSKFGHRDEITNTGLDEIGVNKDLSTKILDASKKSIGADITDVDIRSIKMLSDTILELFRIRSELTDYVESVMKEVAPNVTALVGPTLGARLLSLAGSLEDLAKMPASTIQVLGAEKALFRALRKGGKPPKHGVIFQYPAIHTSPRWQRGKIARALAAKLAIAARIDAFSGRFIGDKLNEELKKRIEEIKTKYAQPPPRKPQEQKRKEEERKGKKGGREKRKGRR
ncbi:C/D box methylation guide ribonucleoprotein complex aNOP56 subunit [Sulfurisphaera ohwakuensis]|uniref:C/D box methylation guide ribonucleoprotein complex aNOP56 subunit n=1 Tax=Sulfurisphaera ohwakuensis TaxID=69656 RepID=A0A650CGS4_SULOH|nr:C/D box methylation guide ribonucleoprotein complex aNOP56 subunit [Sulfurisphaera ohwakuensis]MBB5252544.1 nucleolar protein 56 [Sulfurisphaera ohwakuensis]QGR17012.1 C/D box methylation guide ribonucleoprotein complex aNOP56 subunit [Sulfurisphaera ohwakuensis]